MWVLAVERLVHCHKVTGDFCLVSKSTFFTYLLNPGSSSCINCAFRTEASHKTSHSLTPFLHTNTYTDTQIPPPSEKNKQTKQKNPLGPCFKAACCSQGDLCVFCLSPCGKTQVCKLGLCYEVSEHELKDGSLKPRWLNTVIPFYGQSWHLHATPKAQMLPNTPI